MIRKKTLAAALPTAKVLFFALYSKSQKKKEHTKTQIAPNQHYKSVTTGGIIEAIEVLFVGILHLKNNLYPIQQEYTPQIVEKPVPLQT